MRHHVLACTRVYFCFLYGSVTEFANSSIKPPVHLRTRYKAWCCRRWWHCRRRCARSISVFSPPGLRPHVLGHWYGVVYRHWIAVFFPRVFFDAYIYKSGRTSSLNVRAFRRVVCLRFRTTYGRHPRARFTILLLGA